MSCDNENKSKETRQLSETIGCVLITGMVSIIVATIQNSATKKLIEYQISELKSEVEKHNNVIDRTYKLESETKVLTEQMKAANHRIEDLEKNKA